MASTVDEWVQLATRVPRDLHRRVKAHCIRADISMMAFVVRALEERLAREAGRKSERRRPRG